MITAGMDTREERQRGSGGKKQRRGHANIDKYFIPQHRVSETGAQEESREEGRGRKERLGKKKMKSREDEE